MLVSNCGACTRHLTHDRPLESILDLNVRRQYRQDLTNAIRAYNAEGKKARTWEISFLLRHVAYHTMDHAWEMEDKDLTVVDAR